MGMFRRILNAATNQVDNRQIENDLWKAKHDARYDVLLALGFHKVCQWNGYAPPDGIAEFYQDCDEPWTKICRMRDFHLGMNIADLWWRHVPTVEDALE